MTSNNLRSSVPTEERIHATLAGFVDLLLDAVCVVDAEGRYVFVNAAFERIFGFAPGEVTGTSMIELVAPEDRERTIQAAREIMSGHPKFNFENRYIRKDGQVVHIRWSARWSEAHQLRIAVAHEITESKQAESLQAALYAISEAAHAAEDLPALYQQIHQIIAQLLPAKNFSVAMLNDKDGRLNFPYQVDERDQTATIRVQATAAFCKEIIQTGQPLLLSTDELDSLSGHLGPVGRGNAVCWLGTPLSSQNGTTGALVLKSYSPDCHYTEKDKGLLQFVSTQIATAIERKQLQERLQYMAQYDELTGLPNRGLLHDRLEQALARTRRLHGRMAVLYLDLDNFKHVNDSWGHAAGDLLLKEVAQRLKNSVRDSDTVGRVGGDEFVVLLEDIRSPDCAARLAEQISNTIGEPLDIRDNTLRIKLSIGIAIYPDHGDRVRQLLNHADQAMYRQKKR